MVDDLLTASPAGNAMVRELDLSRITLRLVEKQDKRGEGEEEHVEAKLTGDTLQVLQKCLVSIFLWSSWAQLTSSIVQVNRIDSQRHRWDCQ